MAVATLIGDVVGSRTARDRRRLHDALTAALDRLNREYAPATALRLTVGDEYQGAFTTVGEAIGTALRLRVLLAPEIDVRHGIGWGEVRVLEEDPRVEDGPGWWAARTAIEGVAEAERRPATRGLRTAYETAGGGPAPDAVNAALVTRDELLAGLGEESLSVVAGMLAGMSQKEIAADLGVTPSAVSQRVRRDGLAAVVRADELLGRLE